MRVVKVPTGKIAIIDGRYGKLECLSLGDYGQDKNIKADFFGLDREISGVDNCNEVMPLEKKWVITLSTQYGCSMGCKFCDVPKVGPGRNASVADLNRQLFVGLLLGNGVEYTERLNVHYARMGEPTFNFDNVMTHAIEMKYNIETIVGIRAKTIHPVLSTMMPWRNKKLESNIHDWAYVKNSVYRGEAGLQLSINTTNEKERKVMFGGNAIKLNDIGKLMDGVDDPVGRKYTLNFAAYKGTEIDADALVDLFPVDKFMCKITPIHVTNRAVDNGYIDSERDYFDTLEGELKNAGYDVLLFYPSDNEDLGMITCGNAILSGRLPEVGYEEVVV